MRAQGVAVRPFAGLPLIDARLAATKGEAMRITVAPLPAMQRALDALDAAMAELSPDGGG
jgi:hypothetical protein